MLMTRFWWPHLSCLGSSLCPGCPLPRLVGPLLLSILSVEEEALAQAALRLCGLLLLYRDAWARYKTTSSSKDGALLVGKASTH